MTLTNTRNWRYMNATMQVLLQLTPAKWMAERWNEDPDETPFMTLVTRLWKNGRDGKCTEAANEALPNCRPAWRNDNGQRDAKEILTEIMEGLANETTSKNGSTVIGTCVMSAE